MHDLVGMDLQKMGGAKRTTIHIVLGQLVEDGYFLFGRDGRWCECGFGYARDKMSLTSENRIFCLVCLGSFLI